MKSMILETLKKYFVVNAVIVLVNIEVSIKSKS